MTAATQELRQLVGDKPLLTTTLMSRVREYFQDAQHRKDFEKWYEKKYGKQHVWKK